MGEAEEDVGRYNDCLANWFRMVTQISCRLGDDAISGEDLWLRRIPRSGASGAVALTRIDTGVVDLNRDWLLRCSAAAALPTDHGTKCPPSRYVVAQRSCDQLLLASMKGLVMVRTAARHPNWQGA